MDNGRDSLLYVRTDDESGYPFGRSPRFAMVSILAGAVFNIIFDPVCIFVLKWGMMGAAVATIAGQILTAIFATWYLFHMKAVRLGKGSFKLSPGLMGKFLPLGLTSFLSQLSVVVSMAAINNMIVKYGAMDEIFGQTEYAQIPMAVVGIVMKFFQIVNSISVGLAALLIVELLPGQQTKAPITGPLP